MAAESEVPAPVPASHGGQGSIRFEQEWIDRRALDAAGDPIGVVVDVYADPSTHRPAWLAVSTGFFGTLLAIVPVRGAQRCGDAVVIAHDRHTITTAPIADVVITIHLAQHQRLVDHYHPSRPGPPDRSP